jgi:hypothetical protein
MATKTTTKKIPSIGEPDRPRFSDEQIAARMAALENLRDIRSGSVLWHAGHEGGLNDQGQTVMRGLHSPLSTLIHVYCTDGFRQELEALVLAHMKGETPPRANLVQTCQALIESLDDANGRLSADSLLSWADVVRKAIRGR